MQSFLVTDFGIAYTRTVLIDAVEGQYRVISGAFTRTTATPPDGDVTIGLVRNLQQLEAQTGRTMLGKEGLIRPEQPDGSGFDNFMATASSAGRPLRAVLVALMDDFSLVSARRTLNGTYIEEVGTLSLIGIQSEEDRINAILKDQPDVIFIAGGTDDGNVENMRELVNLVELAVRLLPTGERPIIMYAGNKNLAAWVQAQFKDLTVIFTADNIRPSLGEENLNSAKLKLAQVFDNFLKHQPGGFSDVSDLGGSEIEPSAQSAARVLRYLDTLNTDAGAMLVDVGAGTSTIISSYNGFSTADIFSKLGLGHNIAAVLEIIDWRDIDRWLPFDMSEGDFVAWVHNKALAPLSVAHTLHDLFIEHAITREIVHFLLENSREEWIGAGIDARDTLPYFLPIILSGAVFTYTPPRMAALMVMDALQPVGITELWLDPYSLAAALGTVSRAEPLAVVQTVDNGGFVRLGVSFAPEGRFRGRARMRATLTLPDGEVIEKQLTSGDIWVPSLPAGVTIDVDVRVSRGLNLNGKRREQMSLVTGTAGLIFDMRGRPLVLPAGRRRRQVVGAWFTAVTGIEIEEQLTEEAARQTAVLDAMGVRQAIGIDDAEFPSIKSLPDALPSGEFSTLLGDIPRAPVPQGGDTEFPELDEILSADVQEAPADDLDDLAKELGLR
jgi:hypothetical protein